MVELNAAFLKKIWQRLRDSSVPIVTSEAYSDRSVIAVRLTSLISDHTYLPSTIHGYQMFKFINLSDKPMETFNRLRKQICKADFGAPKASYLHMLRKYRRNLAAIGMTKAMAKAAIIEIEKNSDDSQVLKDFCVPAAISTYK